MKYSLSFIRIISPIYAHVSKLQQQQQQIVKLTAHWLCVVKREP